MKPSNGPHNFCGPRNVYLFLVLKCFNFSTTMKLYRSVVPHNRHLWRNIITHTYALFGPFPAIDHWWPTKLLFFYFELTINHMKVTLYLIVSVRLNLTQNVILSLILYMLPLIWIYNYALYCHLKIFFLIFSMVFAIIT